MVAYASPLRLTSSFAGWYWNAMAGTVKGVAVGRNWRSITCAIALTRNVRLLDGERLDEDAGPAEKHVALAKYNCPDLAFENDGEFQEVYGADQAAVRIMNDLRVTDGLGFAEKMAANAEVSRIIWAGCVRRREGERLRRSSKSETCETKPRTHLFSATLDGPVVAHARASSALTPDARRPASNDLQATVALGG